MSSHDLTQPLGLPLGRLLPHREEDVETEPLSLPTTPPSGVPRPSALVSVKAAETCGPCGSALSVDWVGRTDALQVIKEWRTGHRCHPPLIDDGGSKGAQIERVGFAPE